MFRSAARRTSRPRLITMGAVTALIASLIIVGPQGAQAALSQLGPLDSTGLPTWVDDGAGTRLQLCVDASPPCFTTRPDLTTPPSAENLPPDGEAFYYDAEASIDRGGPLTFMRLAVESTYTGGQPGNPAVNQSMFGRVRFRVASLIPGASYTITYPYGVQTFTADVKGVINATDDVGCFAPCAGNFNAALTTGIGTFLTWDPAVAPAPPAGYIGSFGSPHTAVGSPNGTNFFRIDGPNIGGVGVNRVQTNLFDIQGKLAFSTPAAPVGLTAAAGPANGQISLSWTPPADNGGTAITGYRVYRGASTGVLTPVSPDLAAGTTSFSDTGLGNGTTRFYAVSALNRVGEGVKTAEVNASTFATPSVPQSVVAAAGPAAGQITVSWTPPASTGGGALSGYRVYRGTASGALTAVSPDVAPNSTSFSDTALGNGATRFYAVTAFNSVGESVRSNESSATTFNVPTAPQTLSATAGPARGQISLSWSAPSSNGGSAVSGYRVYRGTASGALSLLGNVGAATTSFTDTALGDGTTRFYAVTAQNLAGEGVRSNEATATTFSIASAPQALAAVGGPGAGQITLSWSPPASNGGAVISGYRVYRGSTSGALTAISPDLAGTTTSFVDSGMADNTTMFYAVTALNAVGESARSTAVSATTLSHASAPLGVTATAGANPGQITVTWNAPSADGGSAVNGYRIYRGTASGALTQLIDVGGAARSFTDSNLPEGAGRFYAVSAITGIGEGARSGEVNATTFARPGTPGALSAATGPNVGQITLNWSAPASDGGAAIGAYRIYRGNASGALTALTDVTGSVRTFTDGNLPEGATRFYALSAINVVGEGARTTEVSAGTLTRPTAPLNLTATAGPNPGQIAVAWSAPSSNGGSTITGYRVYRGASATALAALVDLPSTARSYADTGLGDGTALVYAVTAINSVGESAQSGQASATTWTRPAAPGSLAAVAGPNPGQVTVAWSAPASDGGNAISAYRVFRGTSASTLTFLNSLPGTARSFVDNGLPEGATEFYAVSAVNAVGEGAQSGTASAVTFSRPVAPADVTISVGPANGQLSLSWGAPTNNGGSPLTGFRVYRGSASGALTALTPDLPASARSFSDPTLPDGATRFYQVASVNAVGAGTPSPEVSATTFARPAAPATISARRGTSIGQLVVQWSAPSADGGRPVTGYRIYRGSASGALTAVTDVGASVVSFTDSGMPNGATRFYAVSALNSVGEGVRSIEVSATTLDVPGAPRDLTANASQGISNATLHWKAPASDGGSPVTAFKIFRAGNDGVWRLRATVSGSTYAYLDSGLSLLDPFHYKVTAVNAIGEGAPSNIACARSLPGFLVLGACT